MLWTHSTLQIPQFNVPVESREKLIQCAPWSFEVTWRNYSWKMKHIKDKWRKSIGHTSLGSKFNTMISHTMSGIWASCWILFKTALRLSQVIRIIFRPSQLTDIIHTLQVKPWLGLELYVSFHGWFQFYSWPILQYPTSPHEHPPRVDGYPWYNESSAAPPDHFSPPSSIPYLSTPPPYQTTSPSESLSPTCLSNLNGTCESQHLRRGQGECEYSSQTIKHMVPELVWNLRGCAWEQIVEDWDYPDPSRSLFVAMKNWDSSFFQSKAEELKFGQRQVIALEFINVSVFSCTRYERNSESDLTFFTLVIIATRFAFSRITLKATQASVLALFWKPFEHKGKKMVNARFVARNLISFLSLHYSHLKVTWDSDNIFDVLIKNGLSQIFIIFLSPLM